MGAEIRLEAQEDSQRGQRETLEGILKVGAIALGALFIATPFISATPHTGLWIYGPGVLLHVAHLLWLKRGGGRLVAVSHCTLYFVWVTLAFALVLGGLRVQAAVVYPPLIVMAALVWSRRAAIGLSILVALAAAIIAALETHGLLGPPAPPSTPVQIWGVLTACVVVTAVLMRHALERLERSEARVREQQRLEALGRLAGGVAHDFNNLLTVIMGSAQLAQRDQPSPEIAAIQDAANRASLLTRGLLAFARRQVLVAESVELGRALEDMKPLLERLLRKEDRLVLVMAAEPCRASVDRGQLDRVLLNLIANARDAMPSGGTITVEHGLGTPKNVEPLRHGVHSVFVTVRDTGTGIPAELQARIFEPFFTTKEPGHGTGLGLATVHGIVTQSGGAIAVESELGVGTAFHILLPVAHESALAK